MTPTLDHKVKLLTICCSCGSTIQKGELKDGYASDGLCPACSPSVIANMKEELRIKGGRDGKEGIGRHLRQ